MAEMSVRQEDITLVTRCLDLCRQLASQGEDSISLKLGYFSLSLDTMEKTNTTKVVTKKKQSPSSGRRSARQRQDFLEQKRHTSSGLPPSSDTSAPAAKCNMDITNKKSIESTIKITFKCDQCHSELETEKGLMCCQGNKHKLTNSLIPQVDSHSEYNEVTKPAEVAMEDMDKPPASVIHHEKGRGMYYDTDHRDGQFSYNFSNAKFGIAKEIPVSMELHCINNHFKLKSFTA